MCYANGLVHRAWDRHHDRFNIANTHDDLLRTWEQSKLFVLGTLRSLERDLALDHRLRTCNEAGDGSLPDMKMQLDNFQKFTKSKSTTSMAWHSYCENF